MLPKQNNITATTAKEAPLIKGFKEASTQTDNTMSSELAIDERIRSVAPGHLVLRLPRELRDEVYKHLLCRMYLVELPAIGDAALRLGYCENTTYQTVFRPPLFPQFGLPQAPLGFLTSQAFRASLALALLGSEDIKFPWVTDVKKSQQTKETQYNIAQKQRWNLASPQQYLSILTVSSATYAEIFPLLYAKSTFCFLISEPRKDKLKNSIAGLMKNINIHLDLSRAYERKKSVADQACTLEFTRRLLHKFGGGLVKRNLCIIRIDYPDDNEFLTQPSFIRAIESLTGFETVALRFTPAFMTEEIRRSYSATAHDAVFRGQLEQWHNWQVRNLGLLEADLKGSLGLGRVEYTREDFLALVFHPRSHWTGSPALRFDIEELADPRFSAA